LWRQASLAFLRLGVPPAWWDDLGSQQPTLRGEMIHCPACGADTKISETRSIGKYARRRRICETLTCGKRITTVETIVENARHMGEIAVLPRRDLHKILQMVGRAVISQLGQDAVLAMLNGDETTPEPEPLRDEQPPLRLGLVKTDDK
jgi:hypothetical protein